MKHGFARIAARTRSIKSQLASVNIRENLWPKDSLHLSASVTLSPRDPPQTQPTPEAARRHARARTTGPAATNRDLLDVFEMTINVPVPQT